MRNKNVCRSGFPDRASPGGGTETHPFWTAWRSGGRPCVGGTEIIMSFPQTTPAGRYTGLAGRDNYSRGSGDDPAVRCGVAQTRSVHRHRAVSGYGCPFAIAVGCSKETRQQAGLICGCLVTSGDPSPNRRTSSPLIKLTFISPATGRHS